MDNITQQKRDSYKYFDQIAKRYDFLNHMLSMGIDRRWRKKLIAHLPNNPQHSTSEKTEWAQILDLACGTGDLAMLLGKNSKVSSVVGLDLSKEMLQLGKKKIQKNQLSHKVQLQWGDALNIPFADHSFDAVTVAFGIRNFCDLNASLREIHRVLRPGGKLLILEFSLPTSQFVRAPYLFYFRHILPTLGKWISGHPTAYRYLNQTVEDFPYGKALQKKLMATQFSATTLTPLTCGVATLYSGEKSAGPNPT